jgi:cell division protein FtsZ
MQGAGSALMGIGVGRGEGRAQEAAKAAIDSPLLEVSIDGAKGILFTVAGGKDLSMHEINDAAQIITKSSDPSAKVIFGAIIDERLEDEIKITVIATGFASDEVSFKQNQRRVHSPRIFPVLGMKEADEEEEILEEPIAGHAPSRTQTPNYDEEDELEIPAFIRKRMQAE